MLNLGVAIKPNDQVQPKIRPTPDGGCYISWFDNDPTGHPPFGYDVYLQRLDAAGVAQWADGGIRFADLGMSSTQDYGLDVDANGNALLAFLDDRRPSTTVTAMKVDPTGDAALGKQRAAGLERARLSRQPENNRGRRRRGRRGLDRREQHQVPAL